MTDSMKDYALYYARLGLAVFPLKARGKSPLTEHGCRDATKDTGQIERLWSRWPSANIGVATGSISGGLVVIDLDVDEDRGIDGRETLRRWEADHGALPADTWLSITGRGGYHYFYKDTSIVKNRAGLYEGVDIRGDGGYIVAPPSIHPNGRKYEWEQSPEDTPLAMVNGVVMDFLAGKDLENLGRPFEAPEKIPEGERTNTLVKLVCSQQAKGLSDEAIRAAVRAENEAKCIPPLSDEELEKTVFPALTRYQKGTAPYSARYDRGSGSFKPIVKKGPVILTSMDQVEEETPDWLISGYIPRGQIVLLAGDGGAGKTTVWCNIAAAISSGNRCLLNRMEADNPFTGRFAEPGVVMFFSSEDSPRYTLKKRLREAGANMSNIFHLDVGNEVFSEIKFNSLILTDLVAMYRPVLVIFDPIQAFIPSDIQMGQRNAMRACLSPLIGLGEEYGTTFLIVVHTNKQAGMWGRRRIADSADIWDIARSVMIVGEAAGGLRYLSHEKSNYGPLMDTILFRVEAGGLVFDSYTSKRDREFMQAAQAARYQAPAREEAKSFILDYLKDGEKETSDLDEMMKAQGVSGETLKRAKADLKKEGKIIYFSRGFKPKTHYCKLASHTGSENLT